MSELGEYATLATEGAFFEAPRWHDGRWYVSDFYRYRVIAVAPDGDVEVIAEVPGQPSGLGWLPDGDLLIVSMNDRLILRRSSDGKLTTHADLSHIAVGALNDMVVDAWGRAYAGDFGFDLYAGDPLEGASLVRVDPDGSTALAAADLCFPNGSVLSPDGRTLIVGETFAGRYTAFDVREDGELEGRRVWGQVGEAPPNGLLGDMEAALKFAPDGCAQDAEGRIWAADLVGGRCLLLGEGGTVEDQLEAPEGLEFFACAMGGEDGRTLLLAAAPDYHKDKRLANFEGVLLTTTVEVPSAESA
jgi:sugar lactone lactonase YvrE